MRAAKKYALTYNLLKIQILHIQRVLLDELSSWFNNITHQFGEEIIRFCHVIDLDLKQSARIGVQCSLPELVGVHLAQAFVTLQGQPLFTFCQDRVQQIQWAMDKLATVFADEDGGKVVNFLQVLRKAAGPFGLARSE